MRLNRLVGEQPVDDTAWATGLFPADLRVQAERCRHAARTAQDGSSGEMLFDLARDYDVLAEIWQAMRDESLATYLAEGVDAPRHGVGNPSARDPRRSMRVALHAQANLRSPRHQSSRVSVYDVSQHGCKLDFVERPKVSDRLWVKFEGVEAIESLVCWVDSCIGVEFDRPIHPAVFDLLLKTVGARA